MGHFDLSTSLRRITFTGLSLDRTTFITMKTVLAILLVCVIALEAHTLEKRGFKRCRANGDCGNANKCCIGGFYCGNYAQEGHLCTLSSAFACGCAPGLDCVKTGFLTKRCVDNGGSGGF